MAQVEHTLVTRGYMPQKTVLVVVAVVGEVAAAVVAVAVVAGAAGKHERRLGELVGAAGILQVSLRLS